MTYRSFFILGFSVLSLSACQTLKGIQEDLGSIGTATSNKVAEITAVEEKPAPLATDGSICPAIIIDPQLDSMSEFEDMQKPSDSTLTSRIFLTATQSECSIKGDVLAMHLDLNFRSELGPKAKRKDSDRPFFAYPYFIAVHDGNNAELAREIFAASITYDAKQEKIELVDTINQELPLNEDGTVPAYQIHIGFELSEEQLFYNAGQE